LNGGLLLQQHSQEEIDFLKEIDVFSEKIDRIEKKRRKHEERKASCKTSRDKNRWKKKLNLLEQEFSVLQQRRKNYQARCDALVKE
jgi:F0F1-type ATP synthase epsilon subunit